MSVQTLEPTPVVPVLRLVDPGDAWRADARCRDGAASLTALFFSEDAGDIARAKSYCAGCPVRAQCLDAALGAEAAYGVWGGELVVDGRVVAQAPRRGRPPKVTRPDPVLSWEIPVAEIA